MKITESYIHVAMREYLKRQGWLLVAGEYPNGSDDELNVLSIQDPSVAKDNSPDPRRHSIGEIVPDLVAYKNGIILIVEAKPQYSVDDKKKLIDLLENKVERLISAMNKFMKSKPQFNHISAENATLIPVLAFSNPSFESPCVDDGFGHIYVNTLDKVEMVFFHCPSCEV